MWQEILLPVLILSCGKPHFQFCDPSSTRVCRAPEAGCPHAFLKQFLTPAVTHLARGCPGISRACCSTHIAFHGRSRTTEPSRSDIRILPKVHRHIWCGCVPPLCVLGLGRSHHHFSLVKHPGSLFPSSILVHASCSSQLCSHLWGEPGWTKICLLEERQEPHRR